MRIVFMGSPDFSVPALELLLLNRYPVVAVVTQPDRPAGRGRRLVAPPVKKFAVEQGLPILQPPRLREPTAVAELARLEPDIIVVCAYGQILNQAVLDVPPLQCLNIHFSLLPRHRGASPVAAAILAGDEFTGVSIQLVRLKLDTGPVLARAAVPVLSTDTTGSLTARLSRLGGQLLVDTLPGWIRGEITPQPQDESEASYFPRISKDEGEIDWVRPAGDIWRKVRAYSPWPGTFTIWRGKKLKILEAVVLPNDSGAGAGRVIDSPGGGIELGVATGDGVLGLVNVQLEGRRIMTSAEFRRGQPDFPGSLLPC